MNKGRQLKIYTEKFKLANVAFQDFTFEPNIYDLINAQYALPFYGKDNFEDFIASIITALKSHGIFVGQFFGVNDGWNKPHAKLAFQTKEEIGKMLSGLELIEFIEEEKEGTTAAGTMKHWHVFHFIAKKHD